MSNGDHFFKPRVHESEKEVKSAEGAKQAGASEKDLQTNNQTAEKRGKNDGKRNERSVPQALLATD